MSFQKYRIGEVAKDFGMPNKVVMELVTEKYGKPKSHQQVLTEDQLNVIFDVLTQQNQIDSIEQVYATAAKQEEKPAEVKAESKPEVKAEPKAEEKAEEKVVEQKPAQPKPAQNQAPQGQKPQRA